MEKEVLEVCCERFGYKTNSFRKQKHNFTSWNYLHIISSTFVLLLILIVGSVLIFKNSLRIQLQILYHLGFFFINTDSLGYGPTTMENWGLPSYSMAFRALVINLPYMYVCIEFILHAKLYGRHCNPVMNMIDTNQNQVSPLVEFQYINL